MADAVRRGAFSLTLAQAWHALTGYFIFITAAHLLGPERYGDFALVVWTMTTIEVLVVDGFPRAVSKEVAAQPGAARAIAGRGLQLTLGLALALSALLALSAPAITSAWQAPELTAAVRLSGLDFIVFAGFAVLAQVANGQRAFGRQTLTWLGYSTAKLACVLGALAIEPSIFAGVLGFVLASALGSLWSCAVVGRSLERTAAPKPSAKALSSYGIPLALQAIVWMVAMNIDLWVLRAVGVSGVEFGAYTAAATLAKALFFIFRAVGEAIFPAVVAAKSRGDEAEVSRVVRKGLTQLFVLLLPMAALGVAGAAATLRAIYGAAAYEGASAEFAYLAIGAVLFTTGAVLTQLLAALGSPRRGAVFAAIGLAIQVAALLASGAIFAEDSKTLAMAKAMALAGCAYLLPWAHLLARGQGRLLPGLRALGALVLAAGIGCAFQLWHPTDWWVLPYGGVLYVLALAVAVVTGLLPRGGQRVDISKA